MAFKLDSMESYTVEEMTMTSNIAVQSQGTMADSKSIKKKIASVERHDFEADNDGVKKSKKIKKHKRVSGGDEIMNTESNKANEGSRSHEKALAYSDDDGAERDTKKRKRVDDYDVGMTVQKSKNKQKGSKSDEAVTTPSRSIARKNINFSDQVEDFYAEAKQSNEEDEDEQVDVVRGKWFTKEEDKLIKRSVIEWIKMVIAIALPWRPYSRLYYCTRTLLEEVSKGVWSKDDLELVVEYQNKHGNDWRTLTDTMSKHMNHVKDAWRRIRLASKKKGHWMMEEYQNMVGLVNKDPRMKAFKEKHSKHGMLRDNIVWMAISDPLETRDHAVSYTKWYDQFAEILRCEESDLLIVKEDNEVEKIADEYFSKESELGEDDKLLRDYLLKQMWKEKNGKRKTQVVNKAEIEELKHKLRERDKELAAMQLSFHRKERELDRVHVEFSVKKQKVSVAASEFENKTQLLSQANKNVKIQEDEIHALQKALKEKEEELDIFIGAKRLEQEKLRETEANLNKQTDEWLIAEEFMNIMVEHSEWLSKIQSGRDGILLGIKTQKIDIGYCIEQKKNLEEERIQSLIQREKLERQRHMLQFEREGIRHEIEKLKKL
ncbi:hypothetical protein YC2023_031890 [Brassica napus]